MATRTATPATGASATQAADGHGVAGVHVYLPVLDRSADPPAPPANAVFADVLCTTSGDDCLPPGWRVACGGMGRVRDLVVERLEEGGDGAIAGAPFAAVLAVGDGAALGVPDGDGIRWRVATGTDVNGLNHSTISHDLSSWAVGDSRRIARLDGGRGACWSLVSSGWPTETLNSLELKPDGTPPFGDPWPPGIGGWAVGSTVTETQTVAMIAQLDISRSPPLWRNLTRDDAGALRLPPLFDIQSVPTAAGGQQIWAIGREGDAGVVARMTWINGQWTWRRDDQAVLDGHPSDLVLRTEKQGWAFGNSVDPEPNAALWRLDNGFWRARPWLTHPGQSLLDAYVLDLSTIVYGLTPATGDISAPRDVVRRAIGSGEWTTVARWPADAPIPAGDGHRALAPLGADRYLYALGDGLWLVDAAGGDADEASWKRVWQRLDLDDVAGGPEDGWALADVTAPDGPHLLTVDRAGLHRWLPDAPLPRLRALAKGGSTYWAVGDGGATWWLPEGAPRWRPAPADRTTGGGDLLAVAATPGGALWAAGVDRDGSGRVWRMAAGRWQAIDVPAAPVPLTAVAATDGGTAWATGSGATPIGAVVFIRPASTGPRACPPDVQDTGPWVRSADVCVLTTTSRGVDVTSTGNDVVWLARTRDILRQDGDATTAYSLGVRGPNGDCPAAADSDPCHLPFGCRLTAISAASASAIWAAAVCTLARDDPSRGATRLLRWDGAAWHQATVINTPIRRLVAGTVIGGADDGAPWVWAVGDWTTFVRFAPP